jgi:thioredoxin 2
MSALTADDRGILVKCPSCGRMNRRRFAHVGHTLRCAGCHVGLSPLAAPVETATAEVFDQLIAGSTVPVVVDFWAPWCGPCRMVAPELERLAAMMPGQIVIAKVNTDQLPELGERYRVRSIPTLAVFVDGREVSRRSGAMPAETLREFVAGAMGRRE